jgi:alkylhydroperoxidase/carboxymuconolactone decarboxylase family protein YurZ
VMTHVAVYAGWPAAVSGLATAAEVFAAEDDR